MIRRLAAILLLAAGVASAQTTYTPNLHIPLPPVGSVNWAQSYYTGMLTIDSSIGALQNTYQGAWNSTTNYLLGQFVTYGGVTYIAAVNNINHTPGTDSTWVNLGVGGLPAPGASGCAPVSNGTSYLCTAVVLQSAVAAANGVAPLNSASQVPAANLTPCGASGGAHSAGIVPDPGSSAGTTRYLREDCTWVANGAAFGNANQLAYYPSNGTALAGTNALPNGTTATTQSPGDTTTKVANDAFVAAAVAADGAVLLAPTGSQTVTQPINTNFSVTTSGTGQLLLNGNPVCSYGATGSGCTLLKSFDCSQFSGADASYKYNACVAAVVAAKGGIADTRKLFDFGINGSVTVSETMYTNTSPESYFVLTLLPEACSIQANFTGTSVFQVNNRSAITNLSNSAGGGGVDCNIVLGSSANLSDAAVTTDPSPAGGGSYVSVGGLQVYNFSGGTTANGLFHAQNLLDQSKFYNLVGNNLNGKGFVVNNVCCGFVMDRIQNAQRSATTYPPAACNGQGIALDIQSDNNGPISITNSTFNTYGCNVPLIHIASGVYGVNASNDYFEKDFSAASSTPDTTPMILVDSGSSNSSFDGLTLLNGSTAGLGSSDIFFKNSGTGFVVRNSGVTAGGTPIDDTVATVAEPAFSSGYVSYYHSGAFVLDTANITKLIGGAGAYGTLPTPPTNTVAQFVNANGSPTRVFNESFGSSVSSYFTVGTARGTGASPTATQSGDELGGFNARGYGATGWVANPLGAFRCYANQNMTDSAGGTYCDIATTPNGSITEAEVVKFGSDGIVYIPALTLFPSGGYSAEQDLNVYDTTGTKVPMIQWNNASFGGTSINGRATLQLDGAPGYGACIGQWVAGFGTPNLWFCEDAFGEGTATPLNSSYKGIGVQQGVSDGVYGDLFWAKLADGTLVYEIGATGAAGNLAFGKLNGSYICTADNAHACVPASATTATNLAGGAVGSVPYQTAAGATAFLAGNTAATDQVYTSHGTGAAALAPTLTNSPALSAANMTSFPTLNQNTTGSAASLSISGQTGLLSFTGLTSTNRIKTVRDAADTILELGGSYTPTGTWTSMTFVTPTLGAASATSINKVAITAPATAATLTLANNSTFTTSGAFSWQFTVPGAYTYTLPSATSTLLATNGSGSSLTFGTGTLSLAGNLTTTGAFNPTLAFPAANTYTFPNTASSTLVDTTATQTITGKSIAGSEINSGTVGATYGGTGLNTSASTGVAQVASGTWSVGNVSLTSQVTGVLPSANGGCDVQAAWTPIDSSGASLTFSTAVGAYVKCGKLVTFTFQIVYPTTASGATALIGGLPTTSTSSGPASPIKGFLTYNGTSVSAFITVVGGYSATTFNLYNINASLNNVQLTGAAIQGGGSYIAN